jgi:hypothetical protein
LTRLVEDGVNFHVTGEETVAAAWTTASDGSASLPAAQTMWRPRPVAAVIAWSNRLEPSCDPSWVPRLRLMTIASNPSS